VRYLLDTNACIVYLNRPMSAVRQRLESLSPADVGVGTAGLAIAMANLWSSLKVVGIDPWATSVTLAQENVQNAGLAERIQLREQAVEAFWDTNQFDLAWLPSAFIPERVISEWSYRLLLLPQKLLRLRCRSVNLLDNGSKSN
jgi:predicted nucleic acid-binding protein